MIREKIEMIFEDVLNDTEKRALRTLIYYPKEALQRLHSEGRISPKWYRETLRHMIEIARVLSSKYTRSKVRKAMPKEFGYIIDELLHALPMRTATSSPITSAYWTRLSASRTAMSSSSHSPH